METGFEVRMLGPEDRDCLTNAKDGVFDHAPTPPLVEEFLQDPRHHIAAALDRGSVIGFASGVHYIHPDKPAELFVNEVGVAPEHRRRGVGKAVVQALLDRARQLGCVNAWVLTEPDNQGANALYRSTHGTEAGGTIMYEFRLLS